jgi:hypothetical protein
LTLTAAFLVDLKFDSIDARQSSRPLGGAAALISTRLEGVAAGVDAEELIWACAGKQKAAIAPHITAMT